MNFRGGNELARRTENDTHSNSFTRLLQGDEMRDIHCSLFVMIRAQSAPYLEGARGVKLPSSVLRFAARE